MLAWTRDVVESFAWAVGSDVQGEGARSAVMILAVVWVYVLNIAIQPVQTGVRAFIVDSCPPHQQAEASAWASRIAGLGNVLGCASGLISLHVPGLFPQNSRFKVFCVIASLALGTTVAITCTLVREGGPRTGEIPSRMSRSTVAILRDVHYSIKTIPPITRKVCVVQFYAWMSWFPFLFYITTCVSSLLSAL
jgi:solute carrier family 45, member 1/2/4